MALVVQNPWYVIIQPMHDHMYTNTQIAETFTRIADLLEIRGDVIYKILAYRKASDSLRNLGYDVNEIWSEGKLTDIPGVGKAIAEKIEELLTTGRLEFLEKLEAEVPAGLIDVLQVPGVGPKRAALFWEKAGITNLAELEEAARAGLLRGLPGMGTKSEAKIITGIEALARRTDRIPLGAAWPLAQDLLAFLRSIPGVQAVEAGGSLRRMCATVGDLDLLAAATDSAQVMDAFVNHPGVIRIISQGEIKSSVEFSNHLRAQLWVHPVEQFGTALQYATGSREHNVRLRELARKRGLSLSDQAISRPDGAKILCRTEEEVYKCLNSPWIPPELREDHGEIQAALAGELPTLITLKDIRAELHTHTLWSDGDLSIREIAEAAIERGLEVIAITDHSESLGIAGGLSVEEIRKQRIEIDAVQREMGDGIRILQGCEVEILANGALDYPDHILAELDIVIASIHSSLRQPRQQITQRLVNAIRNPHVDIIGHPTGRLIPNREGADLDMSAIIKACADHQVALEINAHPSRLDLDDVNARMAVAAGVFLSINTDAHSASDLDLLHFGVSTARRGWVTAPDVINSWKTDRLFRWLQERG